MRRVRNRLQHAGAAVAAIAALTAAGCGALPPQAPLAYAKKLDAATGGISTACGDAYRVQAFPNARTARDMKKLEATVSSDVGKLAGVFRRNHKWVYQGDTIAEISSDAVSMLSSCGLRAAAKQLREATTAS